MLEGIFIIFIFQLVGDFLQKIFFLYLPGPVVGMLLLLVTLLISRKNIFFKKNVEQKLLSVSDALITYLPLLFIPVGVGVIMHLSYIKDSLLLVMVIIFISTLLTIGITSLIMNKLYKKNE